MIKVSIVVPVYNIEEKLLTKCINSLLNQTLQEIEIILVDDASTNQTTINILEKYTQLNDKIILLTHSINKKQGGARNSGIKIAKGDFIGFVDADDYIDKHTYELLYNKAIEENADIVDCDLIHVNNNYQVIKDEISISDMDTISMIQNSGRNITKIFSKKLIIDNNIYFPENIFFEDNAISGLHLLYATKVSKVNKSLYYYVRHSNSTISNMNLHLHDKVKAGEIFFNTMKRRGFLELYREPLLTKYFEIYFKTTYRLIMKYDKNYFITLNNILNNMVSNGVKVNSKSIQNRLKKKEKIEIWLLMNMPNLFKFYVNLKYKNYKESE